MAINRLNNKLDSFMINIDSVFSNIEKSLRKIKKYDNLLEEINTSSSTNRGLDLDKFRNLSIDCNVLENSPNYNMVCFVCRKNCYENLNIQYKQEICRSCEHKTDQHSILQKHFEKKKNIFKALPRDLEENQSDFVHISIKDFVSKKKSSYMQFIDDEKERLLSSLRSLEKSTETGDNFFKIIKESLIDAKNVILKTFTINNETSSSNLVNEEKESSKEANKIVLEIVESLIQGNLTEKEATSQIKEIIQQFDYHLENNVETEIIKQILIKGVGAVDDFKSVFGTFDCKKVKLKLNEKKDLNAYLDGIVTREGNLTEKEATSQIKEIIKQFDYQLENNVETEIINQILIKGVCAVDDFKSVFGIKDSKEIKLKLNENKQIIAYIDQTKMLTDEEKKLEVEKILTEMGLEISEEPKINEFLDEFVSKGSIAIENFIEIFGMKHKKTLLAKIENNTKLCRFNRFLTQNSNETNVAEELNKELLKLKYDKTKDEWVNSFVNDFLAKEIKDFKVHEAKFGAKDWSRLKMGIESNHVLNSYNNFHTRENVSNEMELENILKELGYSDENLIRNFIQDFLSRGIDAIYTYESQFGNKYIRKLENKIKNSKALNNLTNGSRSEIFSKKESKSNAALSERENSSPPYKYFKVTEKEAIDKLKSILNNFSYNEYDNEPWLREFIKRFSKSGIRALDEFEHKFGKKDRKKIETEILSNENLQMFCLDLPDEIKANPAYWNDNTSTKLDAKVAVKEATIVVLGATGAGKSSLINLLYLCSKKIKNLKQVNEVLIPTKYLKGTGVNTESDILKQDQSQTQFCHVHKFEIQIEDKNISLSVMDTPGLGDVRGIQQDDENANKIIETISKTNELNSIVLMLNGAEPRVNERVKYIVQRIIGILPNLVKENLILVLSNTRISPNLDVKSLDVEVPSDRVFSIDNFIFSFDLSKISESQLRQINVDFKNLKEKVGLVIKMAIGLKPTSSNSFRQIMEKRDEFKSEIAILISILENNIKKKNYFLKLLNEFKNKENQFNDKIDMNSYEDIQYEVRKKIPTNFYNTCCNQCYSNCHQNCLLEEISSIGDNRFRYCKAFISNQSYFYYNSIPYLYTYPGDICNICQHSYKYHGHYRYLNIKETLKQTVFDPRFTARMRAEKSFHNKKREIMDYFDEKAKEINEEINISENNIFKALDSLNYLCKNFNIMKEIELIKEMLEDKIKTLNEKNQNPMNPNDLEDLAIAKETKGIIVKIFEKWESQNSKVETMEF